MFDRLPGSYEKFNYLLRPSKQVERKLIIESLNRLAALSPHHPVHTYTYVGLGSVYYADFVLFHKYLYIDKMVCVEGSDIPRRMGFNQPWPFISLNMSLVSEVIPKIDRADRHLVWLDYDSTLSTDVLNDVAGFASVLAPGSILLVTVDAEDRIPEDIDMDDTLTGDQKIAQCVERWSEQLGQLYSNQVDRKLFSKLGVKKLFSEVLKNHLHESVDTGRDVEYLQLFNFVYADGAQMLSMGGVIDLPDSLHKLRGSELFDLPFVHEDVEPIPISMPSVTVREKQWLDQNQGKDHQDLPFELTEEKYAAFQRYYKYYPVYFETLV